MQLIKRTGSVPRKQSSGSDRFADIQGAQMSLQSSRAPLLPLKTSRDESTAEQATSSKYACMFCWPLRITAGHFNFKNYNNVKVYTNRNF
jgi:hypothetical protein